ncbi:MAG: anaerobic ribonucleoside-triphosphate reductase activating protein [Peptococcaceae bacterium]|nr:anaerobic ribonucleoside-triphosphate reductase activating protein [Peptococcaceae bacterium]
MLMAMEPFSLVDYPGHIAATIFFGGCNFRCGYCQNPALANMSVEEKSLTSPSGILDFLQTRKGLLDGVCLTGGEPLLSRDMSPLAEKIKEHGFKVKLDTNGSNLERLKDAAPYLDYIAMDIKASPDKYDALTGCKNSWERVSETVDWIKQGRIPFEFRTTVMPVWHTYEDLTAIRELLGQETAWILQQFHHPPEGVLDGQKYEAYPDSWLKEMGNRLNCQVRGLR